MTPSALIAENAARRAALLAPYDPVAGVGGPLERRTLLLDPEDADPRCRAWALPLRMWEQMPVLHEAEAAGCFKALVAREGGDYATAFGFLAVARERYDFEFWCATRVTVKNRKGTIVPFVLNRAQRKIVAAYEGQRLAGLPVRYNVLKSRRLGSTTVTYAYIGWHQMVLYKGRDSWFMGLDKAGAQEVRERFDAIREAHGFTFRNLDQGGNTKRIEERRCDVSVGSVERPNAPSGRDCHFAQLFEIGKWPSNDTVSAERVAQNLEPMCPDIPGTVFVKESSAMGGIGTYFKTICEHSKAGATAAGERPYGFVFVGVPDDPACMEDVPDPEALVSTLSERETGYFLNDGATLEHIAWRRKQSLKDGFEDEWRLMEEYPFNAEEAFQTGERRVFHPLYVMAARKTCRAPLKRGRIVADAETGEGAFSGLHFEDDARGPLSLWVLPGDTYGGLLDGRRIANRYAGAGDSGGAWSGADYNDGSILDRAPRLFGAHPGIVAEWHGHLDQDLFAWELARLGYWYEEALLIVEANRYDSNPAENPQVPAETYTVLDILREHYDNLYVRSSTPEEQFDKSKERVGFQTNVQTKPMIISLLRGRLRRAALEMGLLEGLQMASVVEAEGEQYVEVSAAACDEMDTYLYVQKAARTVMGAAPKKHDDRVMNRALLMFLDGEMDAVRYLAPSQHTRRQYAGYAT